MKTRIKASETVRRGLLLAGIVALSIASSSAQVVGSEPAVRLDPSKPPFVRSAEPVRLETRSPRVFAQSERPVTLDTSEQTRTIAASGQLADAGILKEQAANFAGVVAQKIIERVFNGPGDGYSFREIIDQLENLPEQAEFQGVEDSFQEPYGMGGSVRDVIESIEAVEDMLNEALLSEVLYNSDPFNMVRVVQAAHDDDDLFHKLAEWSNFNDTNENGIDDRFEDWDNDGRINALDNDPLDPDVQITAESEGGLWLLTATLAERLLIELEFIDANGLSNYLADETVVRLSDPAVRQNVEAMLARIVRF